MFKLKSSSKDISLKSTSSGSGTNAEPLVDPAVLRSANLWEFVHRGLYKSHPKLDASRLELLNALCDGAGAPLDKSGPGSPKLGPLEKALTFGSRSGSHTGLDVLRLHNGSSQAIKDAVIETLEAYSREVEAVDQIELTLRERQVGFCEPEEKDWTETWAEIQSRVESTGNRLLHFHVKLRVLQLDIEKDAVVNELDPANGWVVFRYILYPPVHRKTSSFASSAF